MNQYSERKYVIGILILIITLLLIFRLFFLQIVSPSYKLSAENNSRREEIQYPSRGLIFDRNNKLMVANQVAYDIMINPGQMKGFDSLSFCAILGISMPELREGIKKAFSYSKLAPSVFIKQFPAEITSVLQEKLYQYPGFYVQRRTLRKYPRNIASHLLGYVGEVDRSIIEKNKYYQMGDYIGMIGVEKMYEERLRGEKGKKYFLVDVHSRIIGPFQSGRYDVPAKIGTDIQISVDADLQEYGEFLMKNFVGSIIAIEPSTGEILCLVSVPSYPPDLLVGRGLSRNFSSLSSDTLKPLFNRALSASYPPGSTFKLVDALIGLQEGVISPSTMFGCSMGFYFQGEMVGCHSHASPLDLRRAIQNSCNSYFVNVFRKIMEDEKFKNTAESFDNWKKYLLSFGFGDVLNSDLAEEKKGFLPSVQYYDKYFGAGRWNFLTIRSLAIGQGELGITPLQMANMTSAIANRGYYYIPHILRQSQINGLIEQRFLDKHTIDIDSVNFEVVIDGMDLAVNGGAGSTASRARIPDIIVCGKTGTAENPFGKDHSIFIAFAPKVKPKIAIAVYIENGGFGGTWAAPVASLMIEKYLKGNITRPYLETYVLNGKITAEK